MTGAPCRRRAGGGTRRRAWLAGHDLLPMPTLPIKAPRIPEEDAPVGETIARALEMIANTAPFDVTGHPAMSLPCGKVDGLPVGAMPVGAHDAERTIYQARLRAGGRPAGAAGRRHPEVAGAVQNRRRLAR